VDIPRSGDLAPGNALERLIDMGALDADISTSGGIAAIMPDHVTPAQVAGALGGVDVTLSAAIARDAGSVWVLKPRAFRVGRLQFLPADADPGPGVIRLVDSSAFGTGMHPTTALCLEAIQDEAQSSRPERMLDIGAGSAVLALAALGSGIPRAHGIDIDDDALQVARENARLNAVEDRLSLTCGGPDTLEQTWPLIVANVLAAPLIEIAPAIVRLVAHRGRLILSGIPASLEHDVVVAYRHLGMHHVRATSRSGWIALVFQATW
jgi:ribosomal protein L11 methyltransferase